MTSTKDNSAGSKIDSNEFDCVLFSCNFLYLSAGLLRLKSSFAKNFKINRPSQKQIDSQLNST